VHQLAEAEDNLGYFFTFFPACTCAGVTACGEVPHGVLSAGGRTRERFCLAVG